jgi:hypothetical protein
VFWHEKSNKFFFDFSKKKQIQSYLLDFVVSTQIWFEKLLKVTCKRWPDWFFLSKHTFKYISFPFPWYYTYFYSLVFMCSTAVLERAQQIFLWQCLTWLESEMDFSLNAVSDLNSKNIARLWPFSTITESHLLYFTVFEAQVNLIFEENKVLVVLQ